ncbi:MAG: isopentenyl-diphosphate delta-isomerase [Pseudomonadota bacterium]
MTVMIPTWVNGILTPVEKLEAHKRGLKHRAISVFVVASGHTLLQQRALGKYHTPGLWANACCTHPYWEEDSTICAHRRLEEELGLVNLSIEYRDTVEYRADVGGGLTEHEVVDMFVAKGDQAASVPFNPDEVEAVEWVPIDALRDQVKSNPGRFTPWLRIYVDQFFDLIFTPAEV